MSAGVAALQVLYRAVNYQMEPEEPEEPEEPKSEDEAAEVSVLTAFIPVVIVVVVVVVVTPSLPPRPLHGQAPPLSTPQRLLLALIHFVCFPLAPYLMRCKSSVRPVHPPGLFMSHLYRALSER